MKKKNLLLGVLSLTFALSTAVAFGSCEIPGLSQQPTELERVYNEYVLQTQAKGKTPLSYEEWLEKIVNGGGNEQENGGEENNGGENNESEVTDISQYLKYTLNEDGQSYSVGFFSNLEEASEVIDNAKGDSYEAQ